MATSSLPEKYAGEYTKSSSSLPSAHEDLLLDKIHIAVIGGTGIPKLEGYTAEATVNINTPWGAPSSPITIISHGSIYVAFLSRHGLHHELAPHEINSRANIAALRSIGVRCIIAFSAVGSLQEHIRPRDFVVPDQVIDRTKGVRPWTYFEDGVVGHIGFGDPFDSMVGDIVRRCGHTLRNEGVEMVDKGTVICMEGPQFSTRAESKLYQSWGGSVINMSVLPEAKLAREAEIAYQMICMATDYDCWKGEDVNVAMVTGHMRANNQNAGKLIATVLDELSKEEHAEIVGGKIWERQSEGAVAWMTKEHARKQSTVEKLQWLFPGYWSQ